MDIKLKNKNKFIVNLIVIIVILIASIGMCLSYPKIDKSVDEDDYNTFISNGELTNHIANSNYSIYYNILNQSSDESVRPSEVLINSKIPFNTYLKQDEINSAKSEFDEGIYNSQRELINLKNLEYYAINKENNIVENRSENNLSSLADKDIKSENIEKIKKEYRFYAVIDYDEKGNASIGRIYGADKYDFLSKLAENNRNNNLNYNNVDIEKVPIKNMSYVYAIPKKLVYSDSISESIYWNIQHKYREAASIFVVMGLSFVAICALCIPYKEEKYVIGFDKISKIPIEILLPLVTMAYVYIMDSYRYIIQSTLEGNLFNIPQLGLTKDAIQMLTYGINLVYWGILFSVIFIGIVMIKHIFKEGIIKYIKENSLTFKSFRFINRKIFNEVDLKDENKKKILVILGINSILIALMCSLWFFGILGVIVYTITLYIVIKRKYIQISKDYNKLLKATNNIAQGNLDTKIDGELGIFNSLKEELENIQKGFKKAVDEEVKSQKMKTELISNVSHDLKTPLTSIITYVDLLKDENLTGEKRAQYLDTLDRKSQRLQVLIEDLFEMSKASSKDVSLNIVDVDVVSLMKQTIFELEDKISKSSLKVRKNFPERKVILQLDSQRMYRVFENLVVNISKYAMPGSRVYIDIVESGEKVDIVLKNMTADEIGFNANEIVERFTRGDKSRNTEGSGLGLAIAKSFVELQDGNFEVSIDGDLFKVVISFNKN